MPEARARRAAQPRPRRRRGLALLGLAALLVATPAGEDRSATPTTTARQAAAVPVGSVALTLGVTHTEKSIDDGAAPQAAARARRALAAGVRLQNQHLMGWGALNPEPRPGVFDWRSLDRRMALVRATGGTTILTACCAPDWMKGGRPGQTDWSRIETAPQSHHFGDFAKLVAAAVRRYPQIRYVQVWNELKGFWDDRHGRWDMAAYTRLYDDVYRAVKRARPSVRVGGPYVVIDTWARRSAGGRPSALEGPWGRVDQGSLDAVLYWLRHKVGADFVSVDGGTRTRDDGLVTDPVTANRKFAVVTQWLRQHTSLPIMWSELRPSTGRAEHASSARLAAVTADALARLASAGAATALLWEPQERDAAATSDTMDAALWTSTTTSSGGRTLPLYRTVAWWTRHAAAGARVRLGIAGRLDAVITPRSTLLVNPTGAGVVARAGGRSVAVPAFSVREVPGVFDPGHVASG